MRGFVRRQQTNPLLFKLQIDSLINSKTRCPGSNPETFLFPSCIKSLNSANHLQVTKLQIESFMSVLLQLVMFMTSDAHFLTVSWLSNMKTDVHYVAKPSPTVWHLELITSYLLHWENICPVHAVKRPLLMIFAADQALCAPDEGAKVWKSKLFISSCDSPSNRMNDTVDLRVIDTPEARCITISRCYG